MDPAGPSSAAAASNGVEQTVPIILTTSLSQYAIPQGPYMVPVSWKRTHLSTLVNKLVSAGDDDALPSSGAVPFDFIIDANILRSSLTDYLDSQSLTSESTLTIEYVRSTLPPTYTAAFEQDDWISSVDCTHPSSSLFLTSSYDGTVRLFSATSPDEAVMTLSTQTKASAWSGANASLTAARWAPEHKSLATAGMDGKVSMWHVSDEDGEWKCGRKWSGESHNGPVSALDVCRGPSSISVLSGGWEGMVALWDDVEMPADGQEVDDEDEDDMDESEDEAVSKKRRKVANGRSSKTKPDAAASKSGSRMQPTMMMWHAPSTVNSVSGAKNIAAPNSRVSTVLFEKTSSGEINSNRAWSAAYNGTIKGWDLGSGGIEHTQRSMPGEPRPILCLDQLASSSANTFVTGHMERSLGLWDMRDTAQQVCTPITNAHNAPVSAVRSNPKNAVLFASGSHDGTVKVWDTRSPRKALFTLQQQQARASAAAPNGKFQDKILALDWTLDGQTVVAGGQDKKISLYRGSGMAQN